MRRCPSISADKMSQRLSRAPTLFLQAARWTLPCILGATIGCDSTGYRLEWGFKEEAAARRTELSESLVNLSGRWHTWQSLHGRLRREVESLRAGDRVSVDRVAACLASLTGLAEHLSGEESHIAVKQAESLYNSLRDNPEIRVPGRTQSRLRRVSDALRVAARSHGLRV